MNNFILGPQVSTGDYFDQTLIAQCKKYGELFPATPPPADQMDTYVLWNYYDLGRSQYVAYKRTGDPIFQGYARKITDSWWQCPYFKSGVERNPDNNTSPKFAGLVGLILRADDERPDMWDGLYYWTRYHLDLWCMWRMDGTYKDFHIREGGFALHFAILLAKVLPDSFPLTAGGMATNGAQLRARLLADVEDITLNYFGKLQYPDGSWRWDDWYSTGDDGSLLKGIMQPFMVGMLTRPYCDLYEITTNPAVKESIKKQISNACRHLYSGGPFTRGLATHFGVEVGGFHYFYHGGTELNPARYEKGDFPFDTTVDWHVPSARQLMATCIGSFPFAYRISGDEFFKTAGNELWNFAYSGRDGFRAMMNDTAKNFNQHVFGTSCYQGWLGSGVIEPPSPPPIDPPTLPEPPKPPDPSPTVPDPPTGPVPVVTLTSPANGATLSGKATVTVSVTNGTSITEIYLIVDGVVASDGNVSQSKGFDTTKFPDGPHWLFIRAWKGGVPIDSKPPINVMVKNAVEPPLPPVDPPPVDPPPVPIPPPTRPCSITAPASIDVPRNGSRDISIRLDDLTEPTTVTVSGWDGQVSVLPTSKIASPTSAILSFRVKVKNKRMSRTLKFSCTCGEKEVRVNVV